MTDLATSGIVTRTEALAATPVVAGEAAHLFVAPRLGEIAKPTLVMVGEQDPTTPVAASEVIARGIPGARLEIIADASHMAPLEAPDEVNRRLLACLNGL